MSASSICKSRLPLFKASWAAVVLLACVTMYTGASAAEQAAGPFGFQVEVTLSDKAAEKLASLGEAITVSTFYYGQRSKKPSKAELKALEADGQDPSMLEVAGDDAQLPGEGGIATLSGSTITGKETGIWGKNPVSVNVNVFSARLHSEDNLLDCGLFDDSLEIAQSETIQIGCKLIGEH